MKVKEINRLHNHLGNLIRSLSWEWLKVNDPATAAKIKAAAYAELGMTQKIQKARSTRVMSALNRIHDDGFAQ